jgi:hypothetical protein
MDSESEREEHNTISINPRPLVKGLKVTNSSFKKRAKPGDKKVVDIKPYGVDQLVDTMERSPDIGKMLLNRYLIIILGSTVNQNLETKMRK